MNSPRTGSPNIHLEPPTAQTSPSTTAAASPSTSLASFITKPSKSNAAMALAGSAATPSQSSSRAQSLHSSISHQSNSAFTASDAARHLSQEHVARTSQEMFRKIAEYIKSEMLTTGEDYKLLENMNNLTKERYGELAVMAQELMQEVGKLRTTYSDFEPYIARIDEISQQADTISNIATELDEYTKSLEARLKRISK
ncbi:biogenesis of lysosome-related organelles complex 1 subunit 2 [Entomortierella parvispora]|uniref:Biogenesis of lysosome-related organelles complex 1 subunit 2 n=1 Tax=Entomortierella parvispora TaxID=205924 RepID=A0A9P3H4M4_9FUNG|nr:biogenesis of lysosome-related organelles complex 1 subunit 2 [Entomortierella parvispora]